MNKSPYVNDFIEKVMKNINPLSIEFFSLDLGNFSFHQLIIF